MKKILLLLASVLLVASQVRALSFLVNSDIHVSDGTHANYILKSQQKPKMLAYCQAHDDVEAILLCGDMTDSGYESNFATFANEWLAPFAALGIPVHMAYGNHDNYVDHWYDKKAVLEYIKKQEGDVRYSFDSGDIHFICCAQYPDGTGAGCDCLPCTWDTMKWLKKDLEDVGTQTPVVIFCHFNLVGPFSDWWKGANKDTFYNVIKDYNIKCVFTGHLHDTFTQQWRGTIPTACVGGDYFAIGTYENGTFNVVFMNKDGVLKSWNDLLNNDYQELRSLPTTRNPGTQAELTVGKILELEQKIHALRMEQKQLEGSLERLQSSVREKRKLS